ncbi:hypothetical protein J6590_000311 [Homalodisca vitripennis]|nr:hypothetical protein J6590_000311 [Homalodisca vitripennis]
MEHGWFRALGVLFAEVVQKCSDRVHLTYLIKLTPREYLCQTHRLNSLKYLASDGESAAFHHECQCGAVPGCDL